MLQHNFLVIYLLASIYNMSGDLCYKGKMPQQGYFLSELALRLFKDLLRSDPIFSVLIWVKQTIAQADPHGIA